MKSNTYGLQHPFVAKKQPWVGGCLHSYENCTAPPSQTRLLFFAFFALFIGKYFLKEASHSVETKFVIKLAPAINVQLPSVTNIAAAWCMSIITWSTKNLTKHELVTEQVRTKGTKTKVIFFCLFPCFLDRKPRVYKKSFGLKWVRVVQPSLCLCRCHRSPSVFCFSSPVFFFGCEKTRDAGHSYSFLLFCKLQAVFGHRKAKLASGLKRR